MAKIKQLKDKSGTEQIFPKTKTQAIYNSDGTLLSETLDNLYGSLATIESSPTTTSHSVGEYILYEGQVYKVTSIIASGDSLVVGTNISAVNLGDQISTLNSKITGTITPASGWTLQAGSFLRKIGHLCEAYIELTGGTYPSSGWNTVATLPDGFRPIGYFDGAYLDNANDNSVVDVKFGSSGAVQVYRGSASTSTNIRVHAVYLVD